MKWTVATASLLLGITVASDAQAGIYADDLTRCIVESTTKEDRMSFVRWMFASTAAHPAVSGLTTVSAEQMEKSNKEAGELFTRLLTVSCKSQAQKAVRVEGPATIQASFQMLGQLAGSELFSSPEVASAMAGMTKYVDEKAIEELMTK